MRYFNLGVYLYALLVTILLPGLYIGRAQQGEDEILNTLQDTARSRCDADLGNNMTVPESYRLAIGELNLVIDCELSFEVE